MTMAIQTENLTKTYGAKKGLSSCNISIPQSKVVGLVGSNGAGKTTFIQIAVGLITSYSGSISILGEQVSQKSSVISKIGFVAQDTPLYTQYSIKDHLFFAKHMNPNWDNELALQRIERQGLDLRQKVGGLSGGERAQLALTLAVAKKPQLLILDEPVASLDPLARRSFLQYLMEDVADNGMSVMMSSHLMGDLERICDYIVVLASSMVQVASPADELINSHFRIVCSKRNKASLPEAIEVIEESHTDSQSTFIVKSLSQIWDPGLAVESMTLEDIVLAYMSRGQNQLGKNHLKEIR